MIRSPRSLFLTNKTARISVSATTRFLQKRGISLTGPAQRTFLALYHVQQQQKQQGMVADACRTSCRTFSSTHVLREPKKPDDQLAGFHEVKKYEEKSEEQQGEQEDPFSNNAGPGYLPFPPPFHTINVVMLLFLANIITYLLMNFSGNDDVRDFIVDHLTLSHENAWRIYPLFTNAFYQENLLQLAIDCWLLQQFGKTMLGFLGNVRMTFFAALCTLGGSFIHVARQQFELYYGMDPLEVRGRCYGPNPFILGLVGVEGLIFRHLNFIQQPPVPFLVLTAFVMVIDVWRIFTTKPEEHGASTGGALVAYFFWALPTRMLGLDKLTATF
ncbi:rhomboid-like protein [Trypanosoma grayi]|uniref:rhomboid-like protein n=1 Tax=Trypanosoma grayi TaxID=71804 RepID=UPI0004F479E0|nr:rhomboid-like protein [Trypanosoma grayi]KEG10848.1 rhomboid-like protein [Trypanosoma grayi]